MNTLCCRLGHVKLSKVNFAEESLLYLLVKFALEYVDFIADCAVHLLKMQYVNLRPDIQVRLSTLSISYSVPKCCVIIHHYQVYWITFFLS